MEDRERNRTGYGVVDLGVQMFGRTVSIIVALLLLGAAIPAEAAVGVGDNLKLFGDVRVRSEVDVDSGKTDDRSRTRLRFRLGLTYNVSDTVELGARVRTNSDSAQSPHQDLEILNVGSNDDFGIDRAYLKLKFGPDNRGFLWAGKNQIAFWEQTEQFWDADLQPEGIGFGYGLPLGAAKLTLYGGYYYLLENGFNDVFDDDYVIPVQGVLKGDVGPTNLTWAFAAAPLNDDSGTVPGDNETYYLASFQAKAKGVIPVPVQVGFDYHFSSASTENDGFVVQIRTKIAGVGLRFYHYDIPVNSVPAQGAVSQDNFPFSSNFRGQRYQADYKFTNGISFDLRVYDQEADNEMLSASTVPGLGSFVQNTGDRTRYQVNFNVKF